MKPGQLPALIMTDKLGHPHSIDAAYAYEGCEALDIPVIFADANSFICGCHLHNYNEYCMVVGGVHNTRAIFNHLKCFPEPLDYPKELKKYYSNVLPLALGELAEGR